MTSSLQASDDAAKAVQKTPNRVALVDLEAKVESVEYLNPQSSPLLTIAVVKTKNGFVVTGESASADPANHNEELGRKFAYEAAVRKLWPLEGYLLREKLANTPVDPVTSEPTTEDQSSDTQSAAN